VLFGTFIDWTTAGLCPFFAITLRLNTSLTPSGVFFLAADTTFTARCYKIEIKHIIQYNIYPPYVKPPLKIILAVAGNVVFNMLSDYFADWCQFNTRDAEGGVPHDFTR